MGAACTADGRKGRKQDPLFVHRISSAGLPLHGFPWCVRGLARGNDLPGPGRASTANEESAVVASSCAPPAQLSRSTSRARQIVVLSCPRPQAPVWPSAYGPGPARSRSEQSRLWRPALRRHPVRVARLGLSRSQTHDGSFHLPGIRPHPQKTLRRSFPGRIGQRHPVRRFPTRGFAFPASRCSAARPVAVRRSLVGRLSSPSGLLDLFGPLK